MSSKDKKPDMKAELLDEGDGTMAQGEGEKEAKVAKAGVKRKAPDPPSSPAGSVAEEESERGDETKDDKDQSSGATSSGAVLQLPKSKKAKQQWSPQEDEALMLAVIADKKRREMEKSESDDDDEKDDDDERDEDEDEEDWDEIAKSVLLKTPVQCLRRYMRYLNKKGGSGESALGVIATPKEIKTEGKVRNICGKSRVRLGITVIFHTFSLN